MKDYKKVIESSRKSLMNYRLDQKNKKELFSRIIKEECMEAQIEIDYFDFRSYSVQNLLELIESFENEIKFKIIYKIIKEMNKNSESGVPPQEPDDQ